MFVHNWLYRKPAIYWMAGKEYNMQDTLFNYITQWVVLIIFRLC